MELKNIVEKWFSKWEQGDFLNLHVTENFRHTSPFGTIKGKINYLNFVKENKDKFLGYQFKIKDEIYDNEKACVCYTANQDDFNLDVSGCYY